MIHETRSSMGKPERRPEMPLKAVKAQRFCCLEEACQQSGLRREVFLEFVQKEWIQPPRERSAETEDAEWGEEDVLRAQLIRELIKDFGVNDEAVPIILHLIDQLNALRGFNSA